MAGVGPAHRTLRLRVRPYSRAKVVANYAAVFRRLLALQNHAGDRVGRIHAEDRMDGRAGRIRFLHRAPSAVTSYGVR